MRPCSVAACRSFEAHGYRPEEVIAIAFRFVREAVKVGALGRKLRHDELARHEDRYGAGESLRTNQRD
jgi:hypothetical protein